MEEVEGQLEGRNAVQEALKSGRTIDKVFVASGDTDRGLQRLAAQAKEAGAVVVSVDRRKLDAMSFTRSHQGIIALAAAHDYCTIDDILAEAAARGEAPLVVICDELSDPHNLGAILRSAECAGAHGVIIPKRRSVGLTATVAKASAGAVEYMKVARVTNISAAIAELKEKGVWVFGTAAEGSIPMYQADLSGAGAVEYMKVARVTNISAAIAELKEKGVWVFGTAAEGSIPMYQADLSGPAAIVIMKVARVTNISAAIAELKEKGVWVFGTAAEGSIPMYQADLSGPAAIVIGNEGDGMSQLVRKNCDVMVSIPMRGRISSLNASAAASILLYEAVRQRI